MRTARFLALFALCSAMAGTFAQTYPSRPIRIVVGFPPGGGNDIIARMIGSKMQEAWSQPVVIDNRPGANSIIAAEFVAKSAPDGYTLLVNATGGMSVNPVLYTKLPYDPLRDFVPISMVGVFPLVLVVHPSVPVSSVHELIAYAKANPGKLNYSAGSTGFQVATEMFKQMTDTDIKHIPYKGSAASITAVIAGDVQMTIVDTPPLVAQIKAGKVKALAVTSAKRAASMAELPTIAESGVPGYEMVLWIGVFAPAGTPREVVSKLNAEVVRIIRLPDIGEKLGGIGVDPLGNTSEQTAEWIRREIARYGPVVKAANIRAD
ncbi:MAG: tripartite tricarboxylate transporter substrate binding protein [Betaproteobacteria bacterium]|nr:MAG: tripartite tricarboxylate transporter substrate binding protein [Betaproteobacteria bacterium]